MVITLKMNESEIGYCGSKSNKDYTLFVKEQRVDGSWYKINFLYLRCILMDYESNY